MNIQTSKLPEHQAIYTRIRDLILLGYLIPGQAVTIQGLADQIGSGMTPVREAIRRLTAEGALEFGGNRRITVPIITRDTLEQISHARISVEPKLAALAASNMTATCLSRLANYDSKVDQAIDSNDIQQYLENNYRFHFCLYDQADSPVLCRIAVSLWLQIGPALRIVCSRYGTSNLPDKHSEAMAALGVGDASGAAKAISGDIQQGLDQVRLGLPD